MRTAQSKLMLQCAGGAAWAVGAGLSAAWMLRGGGVVRPLASFLAWATALCFVEFLALEDKKHRVSLSEVTKRAVRYGSLSVLGVALGTLFLEYWPVTVTMAFMFAICRSFKEEDSPAYI